jgi:adenylosuccinate lyase
MDQRNRKVTNHDVKPWSTLWDAFEKLGLSQYKEFIHFGLTSGHNKQFLFLQRRRSRKYTCLLLHLN